MTTKENVILYRPLGPEDMALIRQNGSAAFPPCLPGQPIVYPVLTEAHAVEIARDWNVPASDAGSVTRFEVLSSFLEHHRRLPMCSTLNNRASKELAKRLAHIGFRGDSLSAKGAAIGLMLFVILGIVAQPLI